MLVNYFLNDMSYLLLHWVHVSYGHGVHNIIIYSNIIFNIPLVFKISLLFVCINVIEN